jgi:hypothetical protein
VPVTVLRHRGSYTSNSSVLKILGAQDTSRLEPLLLLYSGCCTGVAVVAVAVAGVGVGNGMLVVAVVLYK